MSFSFEFFCCSWIAFTLGKREDHLANNLINSEISVNSVVAGHR